MSLIDPGLFKGEPSDTGARPFSSPYAPGAGPLGAGFKDPRRATRALVAVLGFHIPATALILVLFSWALAAPEIYEEPIVLETANVLSWVVTGSTWTSFGLMLFWFYRANRNARSASTGLETTPGWAVGFFFIPIMSFYRPYRTISEIWRSATEPLSWKSQEDPAIIGWWWGLYIASALGMILSRFAEGEAAGPVYLCALALGIAESAVLVVIVRYVARRQWEGKDQSVFD
ncbi:MAG TPA: DUF4328 domain-containing protein [Caulobacter sp.]|nr:DUF4328 domain-containing protein [Caulobacter sp.]